MRTASVMYSPSLESQPPVVTTAQILTTESLDREETESYQFTLTASDLSLAPMSAFIPVNINVGEVNDNTPLFTSSNFSYAIAEDTDSNFIAQFTVCVVAAVHAQAVYPDITLQWILFVGY